MSYNSGIIDNCEEVDIEPHYAFLCNDVPEKARIRRGAWLHASVYETVIAADVTDAATWTPHIATGKLIILPELQGLFDGGTAIMNPGFGDNKEEYGGSNFKATLRDRNYKQNWGHYRSLVGKSDWHLVYLYETQGHITSKPVSVSPKAAASDNTDDNVVWESEVSWTQHFTPAPFDAPLSVFKTTTMTALEAPELTSSAKTSTSITLNWDEIHNADGYVVERATNVGFTVGKTTVYTGTALTYTNTGLTASTSYYYRAKATSTDEIPESAWSTTLNVTTDA